MSLPPPSAALKKDIEALVVSTATTDDDASNQKDQKAEYFMDSKPTEGTKLPNGNYYFKVLEDDMVTKVSVPFAQINEIVDEQQKQKDQNKEKDAAAATATSTTTKLNQVLEEFGFAIIPDVLSSTLEIETLRSLFAHDLLSIIAKPPHSDAEKFAEIAADPINNFPMDKLTLGHGFCSSYGLVHGRCAWNSRLHPKIRQVFASIYRNNETGENEKDLCSGMDNLFFNNQPGDSPLWELEKKRKKDTKGQRQFSKEERAAKEKKNGGDKEKDDDDNGGNDEDFDEEYNEAALLANNYGERLWPHCDQNMQEMPTGLYRMFQSALYIEGSDQNDNSGSTTVLWPRSHREVTEKMFYEKTFICGHYVPIPTALQASFIRHCRRIPVPAGGLLIWNSRTIHQGWNQGRRLAIPICLEPKSRRTEKAYEKKIAMIRSGGPSTHSASLGKKHDLGFRDKATEADGIIVLHRAHQYLFSRNSETAGQLPKEIMDVI